MTQPKHGLIVAGTDFSDASLKAIKWAVGEAHSNGARLEVVHVVPPLPSGKVSSPHTPPDVLELHKEKLKQFLTSSLDSDTLGAVTWDVVWGEPGDVLVLASELADLLVVGTRGHGTVVGTLLGSVSLHCATHAHCPVVVIRGDD